MTLHEMTRELANKILTEWKFGMALYPEYVIRMALYRTGDLKDLK